MFTKSETLGLSLVGFLGGVAFTVGMWNIKTDSRINYEKEQINAIIDYAFSLEHKLDDDTLDSIHNTINYKEYVNAIRYFTVDE